MHNWSPNIGMPNKKYTTKEKLEVVLDAKSMTIYAASKKYKIDRKRIREWMSQEATLSQADSNSYRLPGGGRKLRSEHLEDFLSMRVTSTRLEKLWVTRSMIVQWAREFVVENGLEMDFSNGWLERFMDRHSFVLRRATNKPALSDVEIVERGTRFVHHLKKMLVEYNISAENIYCLDETALFFDHDKNTTVDVRGARDVQVGICSFIHSFDRFGPRRSESRDFSPHLHQAGNFPPPFL
jgi:hypothetical protein